MKKLFPLIAIAALALTACHKGADALTPEQQDSVALAVWQHYTDSLNNYFENECQSEAEADSALQHYVAFGLDLARQTPGGKIVYKVIGGTYYYLDTAQREELFSLVNPDSLAAYKIDRLYTAFQAEKLTSVGCKFTDFGALTPDGDSLSLGMLVGQTDYVLVDFWASWCGPCRASMPGMKQVYEAAAGRLQILGVSLDADHGKWTDAIKTLGLPWKHISDLKGWDCGPAALYGVMSIPATVLIDKDGNIVKRNAEPAELQALFAE